MHESFVIYRFIHLARLGAGVRATHAGFSPFSRFFAICSPQEEETPS
jgi:hypothetical protein